jgi:hypothetical protein
MQHTALSECGASAGSGPGETPSPTGDPTTLAVALELIELAIEASLRPVDELGGALGRMAHALGDAGPSAAAGDAGQLHAQLRRELAVCVEGLQFHDRLVQQLTHAHRLLAGRGAASPFYCPVPQAAQGSVELF